jgi:Mg-chelatase subunit ChlD
MRSLRKSDNAPRFLFLSVLALVLFFAACAPVTMPAKKSDTAPPGESKMAMIAPEAPAPAEARAAAEKAEASGGKAKAAAARPAKGQEASGLKAGYADDNKQFNYYVHFLEQYAAQAKHYPIDITERIQIKVVDAAGKPVPNAGITVSNNSESLAAGKTYSDGSFLFFPSEYRSDIFRYQATIAHMQQSQKLAIDRQGPRELVVKLGQQRTVPQPLPLDVLFVLDTTGSMGKEIERLKKTIEIINLNLASLSSKPQVRFGMVLYRDRGDEYVTRLIPLTSDLDAFQTELNKVQAAGGGDGPEDLQSALADAVQKIGWNRDGIRLAFVITDAPPHLDYGQKYTYVSAAADAKKQGIKIFSVGTGGLNLAGEYMLRQIAQYTSGKYIFLTYGEQGESEGGAEGSVSHHTGDKFQTDKLETIIIQFAKEEINNVLGAGRESDGDYFSADKVGDEGSAETLQKLFEQAVAQLADYSTIAIPEKTAATVLPISPKDAALAVNAEYFGEQLGLSLSRSKTFTMVERKDLQAILEELKLQLTGAVSDKDAVKVGKLTGAKMIVAGSLYGNAEYYELFLKLLRVESGEVLSVTKARISKKLGL